MSNQLLFTFNGNHIPSTLSKAKRTTVYFGAIENTNTSRVRVYLFGHPQQMKQLAFLVGRYGVNAHTRVFNNLDGEALGSVYELTKGHYPAFQEHYTASNNQKFRAELHIDLHGSSTLKAFPFDEHGNRIDTCIAQSDDIFKLRELIEAFIAAEAERNQQAQKSKSQSEPVQFAFFKGCRDGKAGKTTDKEWLASQDGEVTEAYLYAYNKHSVA